MIISYSKERTAVVVANNKCVKKIMDYLHVCT